MIDFELCVVSFGVLVLAVAEDLKVLSTTIAGFDLLNEQNAALWWAAYVLVRFSAASETTSARR